MVPLESDDYVSPKIKRQSLTDNQAQLLSIKVARASEGQDYNFFQRIRKNFPFITPDVAAREYTARRRIGYNDFITASSLATIVALLGFFPSDGTMEMNGVLVDKLGLIQAVTPIFVAAGLRARFLAQRTPVVSTLKRVTGGFRKDDEPRDKVRRERDELNTLIEGNEGGGG